MTKYTFYYFPLKGIAEGNRLLLAYGGEEFEDKTVGMEDWPTFKPKTKFGQLPMIEFEGKQYAQTVPIARFLGKKYGLGGKTLEEDLEIDQNVEFVNDIRAKAASTYYEPDKVLADQRHEELVANFFPDVLDKLNQIVVSNNGYLACKKLTWGDFVFTGLYEYLKAILRMPDLDTKYPAFKKLYDTVYAIPKVKEYNLKSPKPGYLC